MTLSNQELSEIVRESLREARAAVNSTRGSEEIETDKDRLTRADLDASEALLQYFEDRQFPGFFYSEEIEDRVQTGEDPEYTVVIDDVDGSDNQLRGQGVNPSASPDVNTEDLGRAMLPYCSVVSIFDSVDENLTFNDVIAAGVLHIPQDRLWHAIKGEGLYLDGEEVHTSDATEVTRDVVMGTDLYQGGEENRKLLEMFENAWVKDFGTAAFQLAMVSSSGLDAYVNWLTSRMSCPPVTCS